jgi:tRNA (guanosine-2'-O-)-methyltransferase
LKEYCKPERFVKLSSVIEKRSDNVRFVFENPSNANNVWASLRSLDAFGIQYINLIVAKEQYSQQWRRRQMNEAMGTQKYLSVTQGFNTVEEIQRLKSDGYKIYATDLNSDSMSLSDTNWDTNQKIAIVMGNEVNGISDDVRDLSDAFVKIPMKGFAESLNLSVSVAVIASFLDDKKLIYPNLSELTRKKLLVAWMSRSIRSSLLLLKRNNIHLK